MDMSKEEIYECVSCHRTATVERIKESPICCGKRMQKIPREIRLQPIHTEHA